MIVPLPTPDGPDTTTRRPLVLFIVHILVFVVQSVCHRLRLDCRINLIRFHAIPGVNLEGADMETMTAFRDYLTSHGLFTTIRSSRGEDIFAACGMLSTAKQEENKEELI